jgi:carboxypeptidase T
MKRFGLLLVFAATLPLQAAVDFTQWHDPAEVATILNDFVAAYPTLASITTIGASVEHQPILALKISDNVGTNEPAEGDLVILATHHACEWIGTETALFIAEQLLTRYATDTQLRNDVNNLQIWIVPIVNPDGFAFAQTAGNRFWRKNRRNNGDGTFGVDLNRNWGYQWGLDSGSSPTSSSLTYRGTGAWSEPEIAFLRDFLGGLSNLKAVVTYHSFSELFLRSWSYTTSDPPGEPTLNAIADRSIARIAAVHGHTYAESIWYTSSGEATDWTWGESRVAGFTPELRPTYGDGSPTRFDPPTSEIIPTGQENTAAVLALIHDAAARELWIRDHAGDTGAEPSAVWTSSGWSAEFWTSPDITAVPATLDQGATVTLNVRIHNNSGASRTNVKMDVYFTDPRISLEFPNPAATLIGSRTGLTVPPAGLTVTMPWTVPVGTNSWGERHWCVGAIVMHDRDLPLTTQAQRSSNVAIRNFNTTETVVAGMNLVVAATNFLEVDAELATIIDQASLPPGWRVVLADMPKPQPRAPVALTSIERKGRLLDATGPLLAPGQTVYIPVRVIPPPGAPSGAEANVAVHAALLPLMPGKREPSGNGFTYRVVVK